MTEGWSGKGPRVFRMAAGGEPESGRPSGIVNDSARMVEALERERKRVVRTGAPCCLVLLAVECPDGTAVEQVIQDIGHRLAYNLRPYDDIYVYGPDRFLVSLPHVKPAEMSGVMRRLRDLVADEPVPLSDGREIPVTVSLGCAMMDGDVSLRAVLDRADQALQAAVAAGGDGFRIWSAGL